MFLFLPDPSPNPFSIQWVSVVMQMQKKHMARLCYAMLCYARPRKKVQTYYFHLMGGKGLHFLSLLQFHIFLLWYKFQNGIFVIKFAFITHSHLFSFMFFHSFIHHLLIHLFMIYSFIQSWFTHSFMLD